MTPQVVVVGAGPAGLACAARVASIGISVVLVEGHLPGGQLFDSARVGPVPGAPGHLTGDELATALQEQVAEAGVEFRFGRAVRVHQAGVGAVVRLEDEEEVTAAAVVLAPGTHRSSVTTPDGATVEESLTTHCLPCDAPLLQGKVIAFVGTSSPMPAELSVALPFSDHIVVIRPPDQPEIEVPTGVRLIEGPIASVEGDTGRLLIGVGTTQGLVTVAAATIVPSLGHQPNDELLVGVEGLPQVFVSGSVRPDLRDAAPADVVADGWLTGARVCRLLAVQR